MINTLLERLFSLALQINQVGTHQVFVDLCPHVSSISIRIYNGPWEDGMVSVDFHCYYDDDKSEEELQDMYYNILDYMNMEVE